MGIGIKESKVGQNRYSLGVNILKKVGWGEHRGLNIFFKNCLSRVFLDAGF